VSKTQLLDEHIEGIARSKWKMIHIDQLPEEFVTARILEEIRHIASQFSSLNLHELKPLLRGYQAKENELLKQMLKDNLSKDRDMQQQLLQIELSIECIEHIILIKREYNKLYTSHIIEKNMISGGLFVSGTPRTETLMQLSEGEILQLERRGFRPIQYRNDNGALLNTYDTRVLVGLFKLWLDQGCSKTIQFEFKELADAMLTKPSGGEYNTIYQSLRNIAATWIEYKEYFDKKASTYHSAIVQHRPITSLAFVARTPDEENGKERAAILTFHDILHDSLIRGNYIFINMALYNELPTQYARIIYLNILDAIDTKQYEFELDRMIEHIIVKDEKFNRARTVKMIDTSFNHLLNADILSSYELIKMKNKFTHIKFQPADWIVLSRNLLTNASIEIDEGTF